MSEIEQLQERVAKIEANIKSLSDLSAMNATNNITDDARVMAIYSIVQELAIKAGVTPEDFAAHYRIRYRWWHDHYLRHLEDASPAAAASMDQRSIEEASVPVAYPPLFDPPPGDNA